MYTLCFSLRNVTIFLKINLYRPIHLLIQNMDIIRTTILTLLGKENGSGNGEFVRPVDICNLVLAGD